MKALLWGFCVGFAVSVSTAFAADGGPVLFIGDSHSTGAFGRHLDVLLRDLPGVEVTTHARCGSSPSWWFSGHPTRCDFYSRDAEGHKRSGKTAPTPKMTDLLPAVKPTVTVIALGANQINDTPEEIARTAKKLAATVVASFSRCIWVGPPHGRNKPEPKLTLLYDTLKAAVGDQCFFIDSRPFAHYPPTGGDGAHYDRLGPEGVKMAREWAESVFGKIREALAQHPSPFE